jgi:hypothetical protein
VCCIAAVDAGSDVSPFLPLDAFMPPRDSSSEGDAALNPEEDSMVNLDTGAVDGPIPDSPTQE